ncbi:cytochrome c peroxidase [Loktanella sp. SALINAS62]|uniref:cytochrome-c peroxidase n=1 Tax=Loktanella sp. SALINAS62 TaxID=2706124 RepID=UPI002011432D|nr:cytochrome c peroxidase [Loktanella sp. SALINAS62]
MAQALPPPITESDYLPVDPEAAKLGQLLFYDPILSGNRNVACATCHHPAFGTADAMSLSFGDGGIGLGPDRRADTENPPQDRVPRNAPALFNLGAREFNVLFHDGRLENDPDLPGGIRTPMGADMVAGFDSALSAQTMFPVLSRDEMAGSHSSNDIGRAVRQGLITGPDGAWSRIARRVADVPAYLADFQRVYPHVRTADDLAFTDISNAIAAFMALEWRSDTSQFDAVMRGQARLSGDAADGMDLFYGDAGCVACHAGPFQTDHGFHAMGAPQIGPGKAATFETHQRDEGRFRVTGNPADRFAFRTPSLRNVALTAPYGHAGAHASLQQFLADHGQPTQARFDRALVRLDAPVDADFAVMDDPAQVADIAAAVSVPMPILTDAQIDSLVAFLETLTDPASVDGRLGVPDTVPSGLTVPAVD